MPLGFEVFVKSRIETILGGGPPQRASILSLAVMDGMDKELRAWLSQANGLTREGNHLFICSFEYCRQLESLESEVRN